MIPNRNCNRVDCFRSSLIVAVVMEVISVSSHVDVRLVLTVEMRPVIRVPVWCEVATGGLKFTLPAWSWACSCNGAACCGGVAFCNRAAWCCGAAWGCWTARGYGVKLSLDILFIVIRLLSLSPAPTWPACLFWGNPGKSQAAALLVTSLALALTLFTLWCFNISAKIITWWICK